MSLTTDKNDPRLGHGSDEERTGQNKVYLILSDEERKKGFIRPVRTAYKHVGREMVPGKNGEIVYLDKPHITEGKEYVAYFKIGDLPGGPSLTREMLKEIQTTGHLGGCGSVTTMAREIAETYARDPKFYGATYCCCCQKHLPVSQFVWEGTNEQVGS